MIMKLEENYMLKKWGLNYKMAKIINVENKNKDEIQLTLNVTKDELGDGLDILKNVILFQEKDFKYDSRVIKRGSKDSSVYLLLPSEIRDKLCKIGTYKEKKVAHIGYISKNTFMVKIEK